MLKQMVPVNTAAAAECEFDCDGGVRRQAACGSWIKGSRFASLTAAKA